MKSIAPFIEQEFEGCIYKFPDGYIVVVYDEEDTIYFTKDLTEAKDILAIYEEE